MNAHGCEVCDEFACVLHIPPIDFLRLLRTARAINGRSATERLAAVARVGAYFSRNLWGIYGGVFAGATAFNPDAPPRKKRALRAAPPEVHDLAARDGAALRLTRWKVSGKLLTIKMVSDPQCPDRVALYSGVWKRG